MTTPDRVPVVLLPGMDGTQVLYGPLLRALPESVAPIAVEYPTTGACNYEVALETALAAIDRVPRCHVVGWSFSGPVALRAARARPDAVQSVTLVATFVQPPNPWLPKVAPLLMPPIVGTVRTIRRLPIWLGRAPDDPLRRDKAKIWERVSARTLARRARSIAKVDAREDLQAVTQPIRYLVSSHDKVVPPHNLEQIRSLRPDIDVVTLAGNHFALYANASAGAAAITEFVQRHEPSQTAS